ncbi:MAG: type II toxin-antitoxin system VapB family antitoxin [Gammaproteobacteria bacterium]|nr:type II toxin-antitoxin system VapB family antitoxin [Gammaproteobacteria bacterium]
MKTTLDINDELLARAKRHAKEAGKPLRAVVEEGLRNMLPPSIPRSQYTLPDLRVGDPDTSDPLEQYSWPELRDSIYGDSDT